MAQPAHLARYETRHEPLQFCHSAPLNGEAQSVLIAVDFPVLEDVAPPLHKRLFLGHIVLRLFEEHADNLISGLINEAELDAGSAAVAGEVEEVVDPADEAETVHALVKIADVHARTLLGGFWRCLGLALKVDFYYFFVEREEVIFGERFLWEAQESLDLSLLLLVLLSRLLVS